MNDSASSLAPAPAPAPAPVSVPVRVDLRFALRSRLGERASAPSLDEVTIFRARAQPEANKLLKLQQEGLVGFARLDSEAWQVDAVVACAAKLRGLADTLLVLGIGGSALGARALQDALADDLHALGGPRLVILDTLDPRHVLGRLARLDSSRTALAAISKSGGTLETISLFKLVQAWLSERQPSDWRERVVLVTDPETGAFRELAESEGLTSLPVPADVGGRFSVLTAVGLLPAAFLGLSPADFLAGARASGRLTEAASDPAWDYALVHHLWWREGARVSALMSYREGLSTLGDWFVQLWAESLGKLRPEGAYGWTPLALRGPADQHSILQLLQEGPRDKLLTMIRVHEGEPDVEIPVGQGAIASLGADLAGRCFREILSAEEAGTVAALVADGRPVIELHIDKLDAHHFGALVAFFQRAVAYLGVLAGIDPFDQPGVEAGKRFASAILGRPGAAETASGLAEVLDGRE